MEENERLLTSRLVPLLAGYGLGGTYCGIRWSVKVCKATKVDPEVLLGALTSPGARRVVGRQLINGETIAIVEE